MDNYPEGDEPCPEIIDELLENTPYGWSPYSCVMANGDEYLQFLRFDGNGTLTVAQGWYAIFGVVTERFQVLPDPPEAYIDEDGIDWDPNDPSSSQGFDDDGDCTRSEYPNKSLQTTTTQTGIESPVTSFGPEVQMDRLFRFSLTCWSMKTPLIRS